MDAGTLPQMPGGMLDQPGAEGADAAWLAGPLHRVRPQGSRGGAISPGRGDVMSSMKRTFARAAARRRDPELERRRQVVRAALWLAPAIATVAWLFGWALS